MYLAYIIFIIVMIISFVTGCIITIIEHKLQKKLKEENSSLPRMEDGII